MITVNRPKLDIIASVAAKVFSGAPLLDLYADGDSVQLSTKNVNGSLTAELVCTPPDEAISHRLDAAVFGAALKRLKGRVVDIDMSTDGELLSVSCPTGEHEFALPHMDKQLDLYEANTKAPFAQIGTSEGAFVSAVLACKASGCRSPQDDGTAPLAYLQGGTLYATDGSVSARFSSTSVPKFPVLVPLSELLQYKRLLGKGQDELDVHVSMERLQVTAQDSSLSLAVSTLHDSEVTPSAGLFGAVTDLDGGFNCDADMLRSHVYSALLVGKEMLLTTSPDTVGISAYGTKGRYVGGFESTASCRKTEPTTHRIDAKRLHDALGVLVGGVSVQKSSEGLLLEGRGTVGEYGDIRFLVPYMGGDDGE